MQIAHGSVDPASATDPLAAAHGYFRDHGYAVLRGVLAPAEAALCTDYALLQATEPGYFSDEVSLTAQGRYADALTEALLLRMQPLMERVEGAPLYPCYSYLRIYRHGAELPQHLDRPSCEISTSITLGSREAARWPLCIGSSEGALALDLAPGDMLAYRGAMLPHWRDRFEGTLWIQVFLHYVRADGEHADYRFDGRERIGPFDRRRQRRRLPGAAAQDGEGALPRG